MTPPRCRPIEMHAGEPMANVRHTIRFAMNVP
jgi:hypothetical protein